MVLCMDSFLYRGGFPTLPSSPSLSTAGEKGGRGVCSQMMERLCENHCSPMLIHGSTQGLLKLEGDLTPGLPMA